MLYAGQIPVDEDLGTFIVQHHTSAYIAVNIRLLTDHAMLYYLDHAEDIDHCVPVSSTIRILSDMRTCEFVGVESLPGNNNNYYYYYNKIFLYR